MTDLFERPAVQGEQQPARSSRSEQRARRAAKKRRQRRRRRALVVLLVSLLVVGGAGYLLLNNASDLFGFDNPLEAKDFEGPGTDPVDVVIEPGSTGRDMGAVLTEAGVVASSAAFAKAFDENPNAGKIQPGTHTLLLGMPAKDAVARLVANDSRVETKITIPEGYTVKQILEKASSVTDIPVADFEAAMADTAATGLPAEANGNYEGWLYPTTYVLEPGDVSPQGVIQGMVSQTVMKLDELGVAPEDRETVLNKASLIEREAKYAPDRPKMARAIENRLEINMALQIDAAVAYGLNKPGTELTRDDTQNPDNPYNTYVHKGLPPTPIASPGAESLAAVVNPESGDWIFWTAVNLETGETKFAVTWDEHEANVAELRRWQAENGG
ncbi:endolytic transglycosylase MltG [Cellulosimicrobium cellulans]|uniref:Endolytic murein transglycosylase n=1 Tax=Cellulosimicrobium cellulans TaxID=1710 RepID=A0A4Y4DTF1_CELCE|nr:endolytic transglycosylase MltG [Cellulosimicrobium cellulans]GED08649.1 ABC transporter substrate-binding protein [Cellulosimicrobium cellulans]